MKCDKQTWHPLFLSNHVSLDADDWWQKSQPKCVWASGKGRLLTWQQLRFQLILGLDNYPFQLKWCSAVIDQCPVGLEQSSFGTCSDQLWLPVEHWAKIRLVSWSLRYYTGCSQRDRVLWMFNRMYCCICLRFHLPYKRIITNKWELYCIVFSSLQAEVGYILSITSNSP